MKKTIFALIFGFILATIGSCILILEIMSIDYIDRMPDDMVVGGKSYAYKLDKPLYLDNNFEVIVDNNVPSDEAKVVVSYYVDYVTLYESKNVLMDKTEISFYNDLKLSSPMRILKSMFKDLKENKFYNYTDVEKLTVKVYVHEDNIYKIKNNYSSEDFFLRDETVICPQALEEIARDEDNIYYLTCIKSGTIFLIYNNGNKVNLRDALETNITSIEELIDRGLDVYIEEISL